MNSNVLPLEWPFTFDATILNTVLDYVISRAFKHVIIVTEMLILLRDVSNNSNRNLILLFLAELELLRYGYYSQQHGHER